MKKKKQNKSVVKSLGDLIKVQLDARTIIFVRSKQALKMWLSKYPAAKIMA